MTYMQVLWTEDGYDLEYQEDDIYHHYWLKNFISQEDAVWAMQSYLNKQPYWKTKFEFENKEIATRSQKIGYKVGRFLGTVLKTITNK